MPPQNKHAAKAAQRGEPAPTALEQADAAFERADTNGDGVLSKGELAKFLLCESSFDHDDLSGLFQSLDTDGDSNVSKAEWRAGFVKWLHPDVVPVRFVPYEALKAHGRLPRYGSTKGEFVHPVTGEGNGNLCRHVATFDHEHTFFIFISHRWARPGNGAAGHPDDAEGRKYELILEGLARLCGGPRTVVPEGFEVAVWVDYCCIDQDGAPASELDNLGNLVSMCDAVLTPVVDEAHEEWECPTTWSDYFRQYASENWVEYWRRAWCRVEVMLAAVKPVADFERRALLFRGALQEAIAEGRRPHMLYGTKEAANNRAPIFLPPLLNENFVRYSPVDGDLTKEVDRPLIQRLADDARKDVTDVEQGWVGEHRPRYFTGEAKYVYRNGNSYEGDWVDGRRHGRGVFKHASGASYQGEYRDGKKCGTGQYRYPGGDLYVGEYEYDQRHGQGRIVYADGEQYEGGWLYDKVHGFGRYTFEDGSYYEGEHEAGKRHGPGHLFNPAGVKVAARVYKRGKLEGGKAGGGSSAQSKQHCKACGKAISGTVVTAMGASWHKDCFRCTVCKEPISGKFGQRDGWPCCTKCASSSSRGGGGGGGKEACKACGGALSGSVVTAMGAKFHKECFRCGGCGEPIQGGFAERQGAPWCKDCCTAGQGAGGGQARGAAAGGRGGGAARRGGGGLGQARAAVSTIGNAYADLE